MAERRAKRPKISRGEDGFMPGNIVEIEVQNFMTFDNLTSTPGPRLNLVMGPNGSGKSSLVCAIALGLGGEPQLLGRAASIGAYVKRGKESGYIKISLRGDTIGDKLVIMRKIDTRNKSEWLFNGKVVPKKEIMETIQRFNIQVNNLTQFLPQDRVCEFAKLTPVKLLEETEKAIGDPQLPVLHQNLIDKSGELTRFQKAVEGNAQSLNQQKALNAEQERDVERVRQRDELLVKVESMKKKLPWLKYDMKKADYLEAKKQERDAQAKLDEAAKLLNELKEPIEKKRQVKAAEDAKCKKLKDFLDGNAKKRTELMDTENQLAAQVRGKRQEMEELRRNEQSRQERISKAKEDLNSAERQLANMPPYEPPKEIEGLGTQILEVEASAREKRYLRKEKEKLLDRSKAALNNCVDRLRDMENTNNKRLNALRNSGAEKIFDAYKWVKEHRNEFKKDVYGPVLVEVNVSNRVYADYLEGHVPYYIWKAFITQDSSDRDLLFRNLKAFDVVVINHVGSEGSHKEPFQITEEMQALGICSRLDQVFDAPHAVKEVLTGQFGLEYSYIGSKQTDEKADMVQNIGIMDLWTPQNHYRWSKSRYGGHVSASVESVDRSRLLSCNLDVGELESLKTRKQELEEIISIEEASLRTLQNEIKELEDAGAQLHRQREDIVNEGRRQKRKLEELKNRVQQRKLKLQSMENEEDIETLLAKINQDAGKLNIRRFKCAIEKKNLFISAVAYRKSFVEKNMVSIELESEIKEMQANIKHQEKFALQASLHFEYCKKEVENHKQELASAKRRAESVALITPDLEQAFLEMPATIEELEEAIQDTTSQANSILFLNHNILEEYERRQRTIEELKEKLDSDEKELTSRLEELRALKDRWLPTLRSHVAQINETFSRNFQEMAVAGEVLLEETGNDFKSYGILIKVKFRQTGELKVLSAHHQSGGERSVSTILYLVSLQDLTNCPFRVVDEINQGMDPINERKMFEQLVRAATKPNTPQCFLLTPKLLPDLEYGKDTTILIVMNGPWIDQPAKVWESGGSWGSITTGMVGESRC